MKKDQWPHALIVDDEYFLGQILAQALEHEKIHAVAVTDVDSAIERLGQSHFDIVVSDIYLPGKTGVDLFHYALRTHPDIPFIFMTGNPDLEMAVDFLKKGGYDYIVKPFMIPDFVKKVREVIKRSHKKIREKSLVDDLKQILNKRLEELRIFQDVIESADDGLLVVDTDGIIVKSNVGFEQMTGLGDKDFMHKPLSVLAKHVFPAIDFDEIRRAVGESGFWKQEIKGVRHNQEELIANLSFFPIRNENGRTFAYAALIKDVTDQRRVENALIQSLKKTTLAQEAIIFGLARLAEYRDQDTGYHLERIRNYCKVLAMALAEEDPFKDQVDATFIDTLYRTAPLHDIGKVGIPDYILLKSGKLSPEEYKIMQMHTVIGYHTLQSIREQYGEMDFLDMGIDITYCHHERYDGRGYPRGLRGDEIPLSAQILALADVYDALTTQRVYKNAYSHERSLKIMLKERGQHFEPRLFDVFFSIAQEFDTIRKTYLENRSFNEVIV